MAHTRHSKIHKNKNTYFGIMLTGTDKVSSFDLCYFLYLVGT